MAIIGNNKTSFYYIEFLRSFIKSFRQHTFFLLLEWKNTKSLKESKRKIKKCIKTHVGENIIEARFVGSKNNWKTYDIKCPKCPFVSNRLREHLVKKHGSSQREAHLVETKLRVLFT